MNKVAIIQNRLQPGGRMQVILHFIRVLNEMSITPDILTFRPGMSAAQYAKAYGLKGLKFNIRKVHFDPKIPFEWNILYFNYKINKYLNKYSIVFNSNNTSFFLKESLNLVSYIHFPRKARLLSPQKSIHFPEGNPKSIWDWKSDFLKLAQKLYRRNKHTLANETIITNSEFTRENLLGVYDNLSKKQVKVIYPPVKIPEKKPKIEKKNPKKIISLGRFAPDKRQLEQIKIAEQTPELKYSLIGFISNSCYYEHCKKYIENKQVRNVKLIPNATSTQINNELKQATYFLHSLKNEPFGITTVQAIANGCIPIVHNSGGQKEIVPLKQLRFNNKAEAILHLENLSNQSKKTLNSIHQNLLTHIQKYDISNFEMKMKSILKSKLI